MNYISICAIVKDEDLFIEEWILYHKIIGIDHFYIYDNGSLNSLSILLKKYIDSGLVTVISFPGIGRQMFAYHHCMKYYRSNNKFIAFIDCDEFIHLRKVNNIKPVIQSYQTFGGLGIHWMMYGPNDHDKRPSGLVIDNYLKRSEDSWVVNKHVKTIINTSFGIMAENPHFFFVKNNIIVDERGQQLTSANSGEYCGDIIRLNHYFTKSQEDWISKVNRGMADNIDPNAKRDLEGFQTYQSQCTILDEEICRFSEKIKSELINQ